MERKQNQGTLLMTGVLAGTVGLVAFLVMMVVGGMAFAPAFIGAIILAAAVAVFLVIAFHRKSTEPAVTQAAAAPTPVAEPAPEAAAAPAADPAPAPGPEPEPTPAPAAAPAAKTVVSSDSGSKPTALDGPRAGGADDLKKIKGVGPKLEALLNSLGYYHFDQIAAWGPDEIAWADNELVGFKGRVSRDNWVPQAKELAKG